MKLFLITGSILMALGVLIGAFGAHGLSEILTQNNRVETFETGVKYFFIHTLGILFLSFLSTQNIKGLNTVFYLFLAGILIFSGSLFTLSITNIKWLGAITPIGGLAFIIGWILLAFNASKSI